MTKKQLVYDLKAGRKRLPSLLENSIFLLIKLHSFGSLFYQLISIQINKLLSKSTVKWIKFIQPNQQKKINFLVMYETTKKQRVKD